MALNRIKAITFSSGINFVYRLLDLFKDAEIIFGCEEVMSYTMQEIMAYLGYKDSEEKLTYWHTYNNIEVDAVIGDARVAIEIKSTDTIQTGHKKGLAEFAREHPGVKQIIVSRDRISRRSGDVDLYYVNGWQIIPPNPYAHSRHS